MHRFIDFIWCPVLIPIIFPIIFPCIIAGGLAIYDAHLKEINRIATPHKFNIGQEVCYKLDDRKGIVIDYDPYYSDKRYYTQVTYKVRFTVDKSIGIDTAAGSGFLGDTDHYDPTLYPTIECKEFELKGK